MEVAVVDIFNGYLIYIYRNQVRGWEMDCRGKSTASKI